MVQRIKTGMIADGAVTTLKMANEVEELFGFRNRIINGDMRIDQRNNGGSVSRDGSAYTFQIDRFYSGGLNGSGVFSVQRISDAPVGFRNSIRFTVTTADSSLSSSEEYGFQQNIEGHNVYDFGWGTSAGVTATLSFWVKSSLTGTFGIGIRNANIWNRGYVAQYTINAANTWEYKTIVISPETTGSWGTGTDACINVAFDLGAGSGFNGTVNTWNTNGFTRASGNVSLINTNGATWQVTGVQLEVGSVATPFDRRPYALELTLCQRYFEYGFTRSLTSTNFQGSFNPDHNWFTQFKVEKRGSPTVSRSNVTDTQITFNGITPNIYGFSSEFDATANGQNSSQFNFSASSEI